MLPFPFFRANLLLVALQKDERLAAMYISGYASAGDITRVGLLVQNGIKYAPGELGMKQSIAFPDAHFTAL